MGKNKKRKHAQYVRDTSSDPTPLAASGLAATLALVRASDPPAQDSEDANIEDDWTVVKKTNKNRKDQTRPKETIKKQRNTYPSLTYAELHRLRSSIKISDFQNLVLYCLADGVSPQWVSVQNHSKVTKAVVLFVPGLEKGMMDGQIALDEASLPAGRNRSDPVPAESKRVSTSPDDYMPTRMAAESICVPLKPLAEIFPHWWPVKAPGDERYSKVFSPLHAMLTVPITKSREEETGAKFQKALKAAKESNRSKSERTRITSFLISKEELIENEFTIHPALFITEEEKEQEATRRKAAIESKNEFWFDTAVDGVEHGDVPEEDLEQGTITAGRLILAMDCEMCKAEGGEMVLTRVSLVDWEGTVVLDELVKPKEKIIDYLTQYSGITPQQLDPVSTTLEMVQERLLSLLTPRTILIGHSLNADLGVLKITHPFIIDTSILYQHPRGPPMKSSLKWLAQRYLHREIQKGHGTIGHDSIEDAQACLDLIKLKCERGPTWGTTEAAGESIFKRLLRTPGIGKASLGGGAEGKRGAIVDHGAPEKNYGAMATYCIGCETDLEVVDGVKRAVLGDTDGKTIPGGGVEFTWARFRELENLRTWTSESRQQSRSSSTTSSSPPKSPRGSELGTAVSKTVQRIKDVREFLPPCTLFIVYSGTGDPREMQRLQEMQRTFKREYTSKKWDELSVKWTDHEEQALRSACRIAREGLGFVTIV